MTRHLPTSRNVLELRLAAQRLDAAARADDADVRGVVAAVAGIQAQEAASAALGIRVRSRGLTAADVDRARFEHRSIVAGWFMRGTLHLVPAQDFGWLVRLLGPVFLAASARRFAQLGLDARTTRRGVRAIREALALRGPSTKAEIAEELLARDVTIDPASQAVIHLIRRVALEGDLCLGPMRGAKSTYALAADWLGPERRGNRPLDLGSGPAALARWYLGAFGPAGPEDLARWSGLTVSLARRVFGDLSDELAEVAYGSQRAWALRAGSRALEGGSSPGGRRPEAGPGDADPVVRLLPGLDGFLLGYRDRQATVAPEHERLVKPGGGILRPTVLAEGAAVATWSLDRAAEPAVVRVKPFHAPFDEQVEAGLRAEVADVGRFLGRQTVLGLE